MFDHEDDTITEENAPPKVVSHITTVTNIFAKFPYLKKGDAKSMTTDNDGNLKIRPPVTAEEHQQVQREEKARTILLSALPDEHMGDFYHMIDARDIWNAIKARFDRNAESKKMQKSLLKQKFEEFKISEEEGLDKGNDKMQKILTQMNTLKINLEPEDVNTKFLRGLPPFWTSIALILKTKRGLEYISFDDLYNKLKFLEIDTKGYSSSSSTLSNAAFVSIAGSIQRNLSYQESGDGSYTTTLSVSPGSLSSKGSPKSKCSVVDDVIYSFFANHEIDQHLVYEDLDQMNKEEFEEYDLKHKMAMLSIKVHRFEMKHRRKIKFNGRENASNNYQKYKSKEAGKDGSNSKAMVVVDGSIDWDKQTEEGNTEPRSSENFGMIAGIKIESDADSEGEVVSADDVIPASVSVSVGCTRKQELMTKLDKEIANQAKWNNSGKNLYKLIDSSMFVRTKRGLGLDKYIGEGELGIDDSKFSIFHTNNDELKGQPIYNRFASVDHMKAVPPPLIRNYMHPSNIPDIDESQMVYGKKATDSSEIKTNDYSISYSNDSVLFDFSDSDHDSTDSISSVSAPASEYGDTIVIDCDRQEDFPSVCTSSIETDVKSSKTLCNKFGSFNKESHFRKHKSVASKSCYVCGSYLHLIKDCDLHEQRFAKRNDEGYIRKKTNRETTNPVSAGPPNPVSAGQQNPVFAGQPNPVSAGEATLPCNSIPLSVSVGDGIFGPQPLNIQPKSKYFHSFTHNNQQIIFPITHNSLYSLYMTGGLNGKTIVKPSVGWPWTKYGMLKTKGSKINGGSKSKSWSYTKEKAKDRGIVDSGCSRSMLGNKDKLEDFEDFDGGEVTFGGSTGKILVKGTIKTKTLNFENVLYVEELQHFNLISVSQICDQTHRVLFTKNECLVPS
nr:ribonuclease H-like domain-containing protein [Tanacetum cinerariifolium]